MDVFLTLYAAIIGGSVALVIAVVWDALSRRDPKPLDDRPCEDRGRRS